MRPDRHHGDEEDRVAMEQVTIYREPGRYAGWPANYGMWAWGQEIVVGFTVGHHKTDGAFHARDRKRPFTNVQARSRDGGRSWTVEGFNGRRPGGRGLSADEHLDLSSLQVGELLDGPDGPTDCPGFDLAAPDGALMMARTGIDAGCRSFFYNSSDRCRSWQGPYKLPMFETTGIAARTYFVLEGPHQALFFLTANKRDGREGRIIAVRTTDGCRSFAPVAAVGPEPEGVDFAIMPASVRAPSGLLLCAVRCRGGDRAARQDRNWIDLYGSDDAGASWRAISRPVTFNDLGHNGNPPTLTVLPDGRICLTYGDRDAPYRICAKLSSDEGRSWSETIVLRDHGGNYDIGYPRTVQLDDGTIVTAYYFNDAAGGDGDRFMGCTRWRP